ncbi:MAG: chemotaxis-specific protein-glutamate methyltransferase CheB [Planctomycetota bacterium]
MTIDATTSDRLRILVVDDSAVYRQIVRRVVSAHELVDSVDVASNGAIALRKMDTNAYDLISLDMEMPEVDGIGVLEAMRARQNHTPTVVLSAVTKAGAAKTIRALSLGAGACVLKPDGPSLDENLTQLEDALHPFINRVALDRNVSTSPSITAPTSIDHLQRTRPTELVVIGCSTGGPAALLDVLGALPATFPAPIVIAQHMPPIVTQSLAADLNSNCALTVAEASDGETIQPGCVYIAPGGQHLTLRQVFSTTRLCVNDNPPRNFCRPSVDELFESVPAQLRSETVAVILTGMGTDGRDGCRNLRADGATILAQDEDTCVIYGMPKAVHAEGLADAVLPLASIASALERLGHVRRAA